MEAPECVDDIIEEDKEKITRLLWYFTDHNKDWVDDLVRVIMVTNDGKVKPNLFWDLSD